MADGFATWLCSHGHVPMESMFLGKWKVEPLDYGVAGSHELLSRIAVCTVDLTETSEECLSHPVREKLKKTRPNSWQCLLKVCDKDGNFLPDPVVAKKKRAIAFNYKRVGLDWA